MKKIKTLLTLSLAVVLMASCDDALDIIQDGELSMELKTEEDLEQYLKGQIYSGLDATSEIAFTAVFTDEVSIGVDNGGQDIGLHRFFLNQSDGYVADIWLTHYGVINGVNRLLDQAVKIPVTENYSSTLAEARVLRAYSYLQLLTYYSIDMSNDSALGVMLLDFVPELTTKLPRVSNGEIYNLIEEDLEFGLANLKSKSGADAYKYVSKNLINSIYARMYLYRKNYPLAKEYALKVKNESQLELTKGYFLQPVPATATTPATTEDTFPYRLMWGDLPNKYKQNSTQGEIIFAMSRPQEGSWGNIASIFYFNTTNATGGAFLEMGRNLFNKLNETTGDRRRNEFVDASAKIYVPYETESDYIQKDVLPINKYPGKGSQALRNDLKIFRLSEIYFILAECAVVEGDLPAATNYIKDVRDARNRNGAQAFPVFANPTAAWAGILDERRLELCYEGFRYIDIKRLGVLANRAIDRNPTDDQIKSLPTTIPNGDYRFTLPIPQREISGNPTIQQNPGYNN